MQDMNNKATGFNMKNKIWIIIKHEFISKVKSKGFIIGTLLLPVVMLGFIGIVAFTTYLGMQSENENVVIKINDATGQIATKLANTDATKYVQTTDNADIFKTQLNSNAIQAAIILDSNAINTGYVKLLTNAQTSFNLINKIKDDISNEIKKIRLIQSGIANETLDFIYADVNFDANKITDSGVVKDDSDVKTIISYVMGFAMYMMMFLYGAQVMQGVIEEKQNRIVEILASSVTSFQIMLGKVVGIGTVGLAQVLIWIIMGFVAITLLSSSVISPEIIGNLTGSMQTIDGMQSESEAIALIQEMGLPQISIWHVVGFIFYFLSGYFIFATLFAAAGSTVDQPQDANSITTPLSLLIIIPMIMINSAVLSPDATYVVVFSLFPFFAPILMVARFMAINLPMWQIALSVVLQIVTFILCLKMAGKIYRMGMLRYGKKANFKEIINWIRVK